MLTYVCEDVQEGVGFPGARVTGILSCLMWALEAEPGFSARAVLALDQ